MTPFNNKDYSYLQKKLESGLGPVGKNVTKPCFQRFTFQKGMQDTTKQGLQKETNLMHSNLQSPRLKRPDWGNYSTFRGFGRFGRIQNCIGELRSINNVAYKIQYLTTFFILGPQDNIYKQVEKTDYPRQASPAD